MLPSINELGLGSNSSPRSIMGKPKPVTHANSITARGISLHLGSFLRRDLHQQRRRGEGKRRRSDVVQEASPLSLVTIAAVQAVRASRGEPRRRRGRIRSRPRGAPAAAGVAVPFGGRLGAAETGACGGAHEDRGWRRAWAMVS